MIKPGWVRVNFNYFISEDEFQFILEAVHLIANHGWRLLPHYRFDASTAVWRHRRGLAQPPMSLHAIDYSQGGLSHPHGERNTASKADYASYVEEAHQLFATAGASVEAAEEILEAEAESLRWFPLPHEIRDQIPI
ncbi:MAG: hypothetical protein ABR609_09370 [Acidimicrobiia bacterium]